MHVERYSARQRLPHKRRPSWLVGCGLLSLFGIAILTVAALLLILLIPQITLQLVGFEPLGTTDQVLESERTQVALPTALPALQSPPTTLSLNAGSYGNVTVNSAAADVRLGEDNSVPLVQVRLNESDLLATCRDYSAFCSPEGTPVRNARFDIRANSLVVNGEFSVPQLGTWQAAGVVLQLASDTQLRAVGVELNGQLFAAPPNELGQLIDEVELTANDILRQLSAQIGGRSYNLREIALGEEQLIFTLR